MDSLSLMFHTLYMWGLNRIFSKRDGLLTSLVAQGGLSWAANAQPRTLISVRTWQCQSSVPAEKRLRRALERCSSWPLLPVNMPQAGARGGQPAGNLKANSQWMVEKGGTPNLGSVWRLLFSRGTDAKCFGVAEQCCTRSAQSSVEPHLLKISCLLFLLSWIDAAFSLLRQKTSIHLSAGSLNNLLSLPIWP